jgi:hypothetical protein
VLHSSPLLGNKESGKRKLFELDPSCNMSDILVPGNDTPALPEIHKQVVDALASLPSQVGEGPSNQKEDESCR